MCRHYISPRDFLDLIRSFVSVVGEKRAQLEEQQLHINIGLDKLAATQVATLTRKSARPWREETCSSRTTGQAERRSALTLDRATVLCVQCVLDECGGVAAGVGGQEGRTARQGHARQRQTTADGQTRMHDASGGSAWAAPVVST